MPLRCLQCENSRGHTDRQTKYSNPRCACACPSTAYSFSTVAAPTITSLRQTALDIVTVSWDRPSVLAAGEVTRYRVHYRLSGESQTQTRPADPPTSTTITISGLMNEATYVFTVEVISSSTTILPGVSEGLSITLRKW